MNNILKCNQIRRLRLKGLQQYGSLHSIFRKYHSDKGVYGHKPEISRCQLKKGFARMPGMKQKIQAKHGSLFEVLGPKEQSEIDKNRAENANFYRLVEAFRAHGHRLAQINPLESCDENIPIPPEIQTERYYLDESSTINMSGILYSQKLAAKNCTIKDGMEFLKQAYSGYSGYEFTYIENEYEREWFGQRVEELSEEEIPNDYKVKIAIQMAKSQNFDHFLANKFSTVKRYGGEGCESLMAFFDELLNSCSRTQIDHIVLGMAHRGRLNTLTGPLKFPPVRMFQKMKGMPEFPKDAKASGDVLSHLSTSVDLDANGKKIHFMLLPNPSHLELANPMAVGKTRGKMKNLRNYDYSENELENSPRVLCVQVHGDAAVSGQGINQETLGFAYVPHFRVGGSIHVITNNQLGFTTPEERGRSSSYSSDIAKMIGAPVIHVNADQPEEVIKATKLAVGYREKFHKDIFIDLICFRRWGHNELDDPTFTNPVIYNIINTKKSIPDIYCDNLIASGLLDPNYLKSELDNQNKYLSEELNKVESFAPLKTYLNCHWSHLKQAGEVLTTWDTGINTSLLQFIGIKSVEYPSDFNIHPHLLKTYVKSRISKLTIGTNIDWATAETLAFGSLLYQGFGVRLSGEDVGRGTFSQRHVMLVDQLDGAIVVPLNTVSDNQPEKIEVANTTLSEEAVLAFEYGYSIENPNILTIWEAQFGDFFNGAQIPIDTLFASGETKWMLQSGLVLLLPHGMDGAGPEHSSCRIERFLQLTDSNEVGKVDGDYNNIQVVNPTTPAQYFHLLRRQMIRDFRKPLVIVAPKTLLRLSAATSTLNDMGPNTFFQPILGDNITNKNDVKHIIFVSGKHYYNLKSRRDELNRKDVALIRLESICPFPAKEILDELNQYKNVKTLIWSQEEHQNMGAWSFIRPRFQNLIGENIKYIGRCPLAAPAVGVGQVHKMEAEKIVADSFSY